jgi:hypothetical protein
MAARETRLSVLSEAMAGVAVAVYLLFVYGVLQRAYGTLGRWGGFPTG